MPYNEPIELAIKFAVHKPVDDLMLGLAVCTAGGFELASSLSIDANIVRSIQPGCHEYRARLPVLKLTPGSYYLGLALRSKRGVEDHIPVAVHFDVAPTLESTAALVHRRKGPVIPNLECQLIDA